ncbi:MAG: hypothetical protein ACYC6R_05335 [Anaerolineales bacterium]
MNCKIMRTVHAFVHHEDAGFNERAFARLDDHRTDGQFGRSASLQYLDVRYSFETQYPIISAYAKQTISRL